MSDLFRWLCVVGLLTLLCVLLVRMYRGWKEARSWRGRTITVRSGSGVGGDYQVQSYNPRTKVVTLQSEVSASCDAASEFVVEDRNNSSQGA